MKKLLMFVALFAAATMGASAQLLYKISGNGLKSPSYMVGTYHVAPHTFIDSIPGLKEVYGDIKQMYGEVITADMMKQENLMKMMQAMQLPQGTTLYTIYNEAEINEIDSIVNIVMGVPMKNPMVEKQLISITPQALSTQLTAVISAKMNPTVDMTKPIDAQLQNLAKEKGIKVGGLETLDSQLKILYDVPMEKGKKALLCFVRNFEAGMAQAQHLQDAYMRQDIKDIEAAMYEKMNNECDPTEEELDKLVYNRNREWVKIMPAIMNEAPTLFAVGAGHLISEKGLISLLTDAGYKIEAVGAGKPGCCK